MANFWFTLENISAMILLPQHEKWTPHKENNMQTQVNICLTYSSFLVSEFNGFLILWIL